MSKQTLEEKHGIRRIDPIEYAPGSLLPETDYTLRYAYEWREKALEYHTRNEELSIKIQEQNQTIIDLRAELAELRGKVAEVPIISGEQIVDKKKCCGDCVWFYGDNYYCCNPNSGKNKVISTDYCDFFTGKEA
jgi:hypothetical protein